jgi:hypothetical protein
MAKTLTFTFTNDTKALRIFNAFCAFHKYEDNKLEDETKGEFIRRLTLKWWKRGAIKGEVDQSFQSIQQTITEEIEAIEATTGEN